MKIIKNPNTHRPGILLVTYIDNSRNSGSFFAWDLFKNEPIGGTFNTMTDTTRASLIVTAGCIWISGWLEKNNNDENVYVQNATALKFIEKGKVRYYKTHPENKAYIEKGLPVISQLENKSRFRLWQKGWKLPYTRKWL